LVGRLPLSCLLSLCCFNTITYKIKNKKRTSSSWSKNYVIVPETSFRSLLAN
jgi:hypothetical protein